MTDATQLWQLDATGLAVGIRAGEFSSLEAVDACLARIDTLNGTLNAITEWRADAAREAAAAADRARAAGAQAGALHGVPVTIKANVDVAGWATVNGCAALLDNIAPADSPCVKNWRDAGAIILGRSNTPEFCCRWETSNEVFGATVNPWNAGRTPGGSSGGAAVAVATGMSPLSSGTDLGGSLRQPAQACGVASLRPGRCRVPDFNPTDPGPPGIGFQLMNVNGPMARSVRDLDLGFRAMLPGDRRDPWWVPVPLTAPAPVATVAQVMEPGGGPTAPAVRDALARAGDILAAAGIRVEQAAPPRLADAAEVWRTVCISELLGQLRPAVKDVCGAALTRTFECYEVALGEFSHERFSRALATRIAVLREWDLWFEDFPLLLAPIGTQPVLTRDADIASPEQAIEVIDSYRMTVAVNALGLPAVTVPVGVYEGMPGAVQIIGPMFSELKCLALAAILEAAAPPLTPIDPR